MTPASVFASQLPFVTERVGACAIYCSDGRYNEQFDEFLHTHLSLPRYDRLVIPGGAAALAGHFISHRDEPALLDQIEFLVRSHELERLVLIAHRSCGFYLKRLHLPEHRLHEQQVKDLNAARARIASIANHVRTDAFIAGVEAGKVLFEAVGE